MKKESKVYFGHTRLSIIDLSNNASQPMEDNSGNVIIYNGEIYNYMEILRRSQKLWVF